VRRLTHLLWNPDGNLRLAEHALLERLLADVAEWKDGRDPPPEALVSYRLVQHLVESHVAPDGLAPPGRADGEPGRVRYQFKLVELPGAAGRVGGDLLVSREHEA
jgi:hypothetical protein